jgi:hypothetical protein
MVPVARSGSFDSSASVRALAANDSVNLSRDNSSLSGGQKDKRRSDFDWLSWAFERGCFVVLPNSRRILSSIVTTARPNVISDLSDDF